MYVYRVQLQIRYIDFEIDDWLNIKWNTSIYICIYTYIYISTIYKMDIWIFEMSIYTYIHMCIYIHIHNLWSDNTDQYQYNDQQRAAMGYCCGHHSPTPICRYICVFMCICIVYIYLNILYLHKICQ